MPWCSCTFASSQVGERAWTDWIKIHSAQMIINQPADRSALCSWSQYVGPNRRCGSWLPVKQTEMEVRSAEARILYRTTGPVGPKSQRGLCQMSRILWGRWGESKTWGLGQKMSGCTFYGLDTPETSYSMINFIGVFTISWRLAKARDEISTCQMHTE